MVHKQRKPQVCRNKERPSASSASPASPSNQSASKVSSSMNSVMSSSATSQESKDDRLLHINRVIQKYAAFCTLQDNLQTAHDLLLKAKQQAKEVGQGIHSRHQAALPGQRPMLKDHASCSWPKSMAPKRQELLYAIHSSRSDDPAAGKLI